MSKFTLSEILDASDIAINQYYDGSSESWNEAFNKIPGICKNKRIPKNDSIYISIISESVAIQAGFICQAASPAAGMTVGGGTLGGGGQVPGGTTIDPL